MNGGAGGATDPILASWRTEMENEWQTILDWWMTRMPDPQGGGFFGALDENDRVVAGAEKGVVLNSRILWTFSASLAVEKRPEYLLMATRAYGYLKEHFADREHGGVYWSVDPHGRMCNGRKQVYGQAFYLYGLSEYFIATKDTGALGLATGLFHVIERHAYDNVRQGYYEAFTREWGPQEDLRLSARDANEKKTTNTHLHVIEAYANLYRAWPDELLRERIVGLLEVFERYMIDPATGHLLLFFDEDWKPGSGLVSYGHDIEAAWLLQSCAEVIGDDRWIAKTKQWAIRIATAALEGLDGDGGLWYEREHGRLVREKHWWPQAEAVVGFLNAWQLSGEWDWLGRAMAVWRFVKEHIRDEPGGEWFWGVDADHRPMPGQQKAGLWKCPYHNGRACLEVMRRLGRGQ